MEIRSLSFFLLLLLASCDAIQFGQPQLTPQFSTVQGVQLKAADIEVPISFDADETDDLFLLTEGFVCPGQSSAMSCQAASDCSCDYATVACADLPSCCEATDPDLFASACGASAPTSWILLEPGVTKNVTAPPIRTAISPVYMRYHPSSDAACRGFGLSVLAPFEELGVSLSVWQRVIYYVSFTNARPETDKNAPIFSPRCGQSDNTGRPRFCPSYDDDSSTLNGFFGASNNRTAFISIYSLTTDTSYANQNAEVTVALYETPDVSAITTQVAGSDLAETTAVADRTTIVVPEDQSSASFSYTHPGSSCANLVVDAHTNAELADVSMTADYTEGYVRWVQSGHSSAASITVNICPDETLYFKVTITETTSKASPGPTLTLVTAYAGATTPLLNTREINPNLYGPLLAGAKTARMICNTNNFNTFEWGTDAPKYTTDDDRFVVTCIGSYIGSNTPSCQIYPIANRQNASLLWPAPPTGILAVTSYAMLETDVLSARIGDVLSSNLRFAVILQQMIYQSTYYGSRVGWVFRTWDQLADCKFDFGGTLLSSTGNRIFGESAALGHINETYCDPNSFRATLTELQDTADMFLNTTFRSQSIPTQRTAMVREMSIALTSDFSTCTYTPQEVYLTPYVNSVNCTTTDPCCSLSDQYFCYFYDYCSTGKYVSVHPEINYDAIDEVGGEVSCSTALSLETTTSLVFISTGANAVSNVPCIFGQDDTDLMRKQIRAYYANCRTAVAGAFDKGVPCATVDDCPDHPQMACLPFTVTNLDNPALSTPYRRAKMCQAPTAVFDELLLQCLVDTMPAAVLNTWKNAFTAAGLTGTMYENLAAYGAIEGCAATGPSFLQTNAAVNEFKLRTYNTNGESYNSCYNTGTCPYPITCIDAFCELSQGCTYPWGCNNQWTAYTVPPTEATCASAYQCNFVAPGATSPDPCTGDEDTCQEKCSQDMGDGFCGYCDEASGYCYVATDSDGNALSQDQCETASGSETCFIQDLGSLVAAPCKGYGSCNHFSDSTKSMTAVTEAECTVAPGLCLTTEGSIMFPQTAGCLGVVQRANLGCANQDAMLTDSGCLYSTSVFPDKESCLDGADPIVPTRQMRGWLEVVDTEEECTANEDMFVCTLPYQKSVPLSGGVVLNNRTQCEQRGGTFESPYRWEAPSFIAGVDVTVGWMSVKAVAAGNWTKRQSFPKMATVINNFINTLQLGCDGMSSICVYSNILTVSALGAACQADPESADNIEPCQPIWEISSDEVPTQYLGMEPVCDAHKIEDTTVTYPSQFSVPPVTLEFTNKTDLTADSYSQITFCVHVNGYLKSNSKFAQSRERIRETSFFIARQDEDIVPLATLSSGVVVNGLMVTDALKVSADKTHVYEAWFCIQARSDFKDTIEAMYTDWSTMTLGLATLDNWAVTPMKSKATDIKSTWLGSDGTLYSDVIGNTFPENMTISNLVEVCRRFDEYKIETDAALFYVGVITFTEDPEDVPNGFTTAETVWLYITACVYLSPVVFMWIPLLIRSLLAKQSIFSVPMISTFFLSMFLIFRAALLFGLADGTIVASSTTEFALTDIAVWCEFAAVCLLGLVITIAIASADKMKSSKGFSNSRLQQACFIFMVIFLLAVFVAFVIAYSQSGDTSSGVTNPVTSCEGRVPEGTSQWTTRRILRLSYECLLAVMGLLIGLWLIWISFSISTKTKASNSGTQLFRLTGSTAMLAMMILSHAVIALILIGTQYNNFIFGITMLYVTELLPLVGFFLLSLWKNITEFTSFSISWRTGTSGSRKSGKGRTSSGTRSDGRSGASTGHHTTQSDQL